MSIYISMPDPKRQLTRDINRKGLSTPLNSIIREILINGSEANRRKLGNERGKLYVQRDEFLKNKISITNVGGAFFSEDEAKNNLNTVANSGNENCETATGLASNMGQGAKISYLPWCPQGILYKSKDSDGEGHAFHLKLIEDSEFYGLQSKWCDYHEDYLEFQYCNSFNSTLENTDQTGTTAILMGTHEEEDTWIKMCTECSPTKQETSAGWSLYKFISNRLFRDIGDDIYVDIYNTETGENSKSQKVRTTFDIMSQTDSYSSMELVGDDVPSGTILHYCLKKDFFNQSSYSKFVKLNGNIYFAWKKENYFDMNDSGVTRSSKLRQCGIWHKPTEWILVVELPDDWEGHPTENRTQLSNINEFAFYAAIRDNLPEEISDWMSQNAYKDVDCKDVSKWLREAFKNYVKDLPSLNRTSNENGTKDDPPATQNNDSSPNDEEKDKEKDKKDKRKRSKKRSLEKLKSFQNPHVQIIEDEDGPLLEFMFEEYTVLLNTSHDLYANREERFLNEYQHIDSSIIKDHLVKYHLKGAVSRIFDVQNQYTKHSVGERKQKWTPDVLEATWNHDSTTAVQRNLGRFKKTAQAAK